MSDDGRFRIVATGSREWTDEAVIRHKLAEYDRAHPEGVILMHGGARGADTLVGKVARALGWTVLVEPVTDAEWQQFRKSAGHRRNRRMLDKHDPHVVVGFKVARPSNGTTGCVTDARRRGIAVDLTDLGQVTLL